MFSFKSDLKLYTTDYTFINILKCFLNINVWMVMIYRVSNFWFRHKVFVLSKLFWLLNRLVFSIDIDPGASIGPGFKLVHPIGIVVGRQVISEGNLVLYQNVTIGGSVNKIKTYNNIEIEQPYFKKNTVVFASAVVVGPVVIGSDVIIGANAVVTKDVKDNTMVYGQNQYCENKGRYTGFN